MKVIRNKLHIFQYKYFGAQLFQKTSWTCWMLAASFDGHICIQKNKNVTNHSLQEVQENERTEIWMDRYDIVKWL